MSLLNPFGKKKQETKDEPKKNEEKLDAVSEDSDDAKSKGKEKKQEESEKKEVDSKGEICQMKRGDYMIHIYVEQAKNLKIEADDVVDPIVEIKCMGQRKFTTAQEGINNSGVAIWNEHLFFEPKNKEVEELEQAKVEIKLMDKGYFKDALIGFYEFDLSYLYQMKDHVMMHKWIIMTNPESEEYGEVTAQLKISISITGEGDEQVIIEDDPHPEKEDVIQPPSVKPQFYQLRFRFFTGQRIVPMDTKVIGEDSTDAYVRLDYKTTRLKTKVKTVKESENAMWNQEFLVPAQLPIIGGRIVFKLFDEDLTGDEIIGSFHFEMKDFLPGKDGKKGRLDGVFDWKNIYGAPLDFSGKVCKLMNNNPEIASYWKGRLLTQVVAEKTDKPLLKIQDVEDEELINKAATCLQNRSFQFACIVNGLYALPKDSEEFRVSVRIADKEWKTKRTKELDGDKKVLVKTKYNRFNQYITENEREFLSPYQGVKDMGTVFVYLWAKPTIGKERRVCFWKGDIMKFTNPNPGLQWVELEPDLAVGEVKEHFRAGIVGIKMAIHDVTANGPIDWNDYPAWQMPLPRRPKVIKVRVFIWQARDLPAADDSGSSDPFVVVTDSDRSKSTSVIWDNVNPLFYEGIDAEYEANKIEEIPPFVIDVYDKDESIIGSDSEDFLSRATLYLKDLKDSCVMAIEDKSKADSIPRPSWYNLYYKKGGAVSGQILLSFVITGPDEAFQCADPRNLNLEAEVQMKEHQVSINILGLRGLMSPGLLPIKKAFLQFNLKSMVPPKLGANLQNIRTEPKMPGTDPTLNTLIEFKAPLPTDQLFCPRMSCNVFDNIAMGLSQPQIGCFVIPIGDLMWDLARERKEESEALAYVVSEIKKMVAGERLAAGFRKLIQKKIDQEEERLTRELKEQQVKQAIRDSLAVQMMAQQAEEHLRNTQIAEPLLTGDYDEENRMTERTQSMKKAAVEGSNERLSADVIEQVAQSLKQRATKEYDNQVDDKIKRTLSNGGQNEKHISHFDPKLKAELLKLQALKQQSLKVQNMEQRKKAEENFEGVDNIIMPKYEKDEKMDVDREYDVPPQEIFLGLGWDQDQTTQRKHYRRYYPDELENIKEVLPIPSPFNQYNLKRGKTRGNSASFWQVLTNNYRTDESGQVSTDKVVGRFKAVIEVEAKEERNQYFNEKHKMIDQLITSLRELAKNRGIKDFDLDLEKLESMEGRAEMKLSMEPLQVNHLNVVEKLADIESDIILKRMLVKTEQMIVRIYMIEGCELASRDIGGFSDPYIILRLGDKKISDRKNYILDEPNPKFGKHWDFEAKFPGCPMLFIDAMDYDDLFGDDLIGTTTVDLEDRYFLPEWRHIKNKPVEYRQIYHPSCSYSQGQLKMWIEINPASYPPEQEPKLWDISYKPPQEFQVRVCVFDTRDIKMMDDEGTSDVFIRCFFDSKKEALETDTHWRCQTGTASFNYRLMFKVTWPRKDYRLTVQAYDRDFFKSNDVIGMSMIDLKQAFDDAELTQRPLQINKEYYDDYMRKPDDKPLEWDKDGESFWLPMLSRNSETGEMEDNGHVRIRVDITTMEYAETNKIGSARNDPNMEPFLPPPIGRISFSFNPCDMYKQLIGPKMRRKIAIWCSIFICAVLCFMILYYLVPIVLGNLITNWVIRGF